MVSPIFYKFVEAVIWNFYYNASNFSPSIYGVTLQRARFVPGKSAVEALYFDIIVIMLI